MADIVLKPNDPLLHNQLNSYVGRLRNEGYSVKLERPVEQRGGIPPEVTTLVITVGAVILSKEYDKVKRFFRDRFTKQAPPRGHRRRLEVRVEDERHQLCDQFKMEDEPVLEEGRPSEQT